MKEARKLLRYMEAQNELSRCMAMEIHRLKEAVSLMSEILDSMREWIDVVGPSLDGKLMLLDNMISELMTEKREGFLNS